MSEFNDFQAAKEAAREAGRVSALLESIESQLDKLTSGYKESSAEFSQRIAKVESIKERYEESRAELRDLGKEFDSYRIKSTSEIGSLSTQIKIYASLAGAVGTAVGALLMDYFAKHLK